MLPFSISAFWVSGAPLFDQRLQGGNGYGTIKSEDEAVLLTAAFADPPHFDLMREADLHYDNAGYCEKCWVAYCYTHWNTTTTGYGICPHGHGKSLDPHWSPED